jgi:hypothetical protein
MNITASVVRVTSSETLVFVLILGFPPPDFSIISISIQLIAHIARGWKAIRPGSLKVGRLENNLACKLPSLLAFQLLARI